MKIITSLKKYSKAELAVFLIIFLGLLLVLVKGLLIDVTRDAAKYAFIAKQMAEDGDWLHLKILGEFYEQKPQFMFWLSSVSIRLFGASNLTFKLPILVYSLFGVLFTGKFGQLMYGRKTGLYASLITLFSIIFVLYNQDLHTDTVLFTNTAFTLWMLALYFLKKRKTFLLLAGVGTGLSIMTKGPFGAVVPALFVFTHLVHTKKYKELYNPRWLIVVFTALLVSLPALINMYANMGWDGISFFFFQNTLGRYTGSYLENFPDPSFYFHNLVYLFLPWIFVFFLALFHFIKFWIRHKKLQDNAAPYLTIFIWLILMSLSLSKMPNYLMTLLPLISIVTSLAWQNSILSHKKLNKTQFILNEVFLGIGLLVYILFTRGNIFSWILLPLIIFVLIHFLVLKLKIKHRLLLHTLSIALILCFLLNFSVVPILFDHQAQPKAAKLINKEYGTDYHVYNYQKSALRNLKRLQAISGQSEKQMEQTPDKKHFSRNYELMFYCDARIIQLEDDRNLKAVLKYPAVIYTDEEGLKEMRKQEITIKELFQFEHFNLNSIGSYVLSKNDGSVLENNYLVVLN